MTLQEMIDKIERLDTTFPALAEDIMKEQVYAGRTMRRSGELQRSIKTEKTGDHSWFVGTDLDYARYINYGRREIRMPQDAKHPGVYPLRWMAEGGEVHSMRSSAVPPDNFVGRTASLLLLAIKSLF